MKRDSLRPALAALAFLSGSTLFAAPAAGPASFTIPVEYHKLDNGLRVVLSRDTTSPKAVVAVYYNIGFRIEPKDRTGAGRRFPSDFEPLDWSDAVARLDHGRVAGRGLS